MSFAATIAASDLTQRRVAMLDQWAALGVSLLEKVASTFGRSLHDGIAAMARITQAIRLAIALATRLSNPDHPAFQPTPARARAAASAPAAPKDRVEDEGVEDERVETPERERRPRGEREISDAAILRRPLAEIVKVICRALGVTPDLSLWSEDDQPAGDPEPNPAVAPPPDPGRPIPKPRPWPDLILNRSASPPAPGRLSARLRSSCAPLALDPLAAPASGRVRLPGDREAAPGSADVLARTFARRIAKAQ